MDDFWSFVKVGSLDDCWPWQGRRTQKNYGRCSTKYGSLSPHRVAWERWNGVKLGALYACHSCDNPPCCNPMHIFAGSHDDNLQDYLRKFGHPRSMAGKKHSAAARKKMSAAHKANPMSGPKNHMFGAGYKVAGSGNPFYGRKHSEEAKAKMRTARARQFSTKKV